MLHRYITNNKTKYKFYALSSSGPDSVYPSEDICKNWILPSGDERNDSKTD